MKPGLSVHWPALLHELQSSWMSAHLGAQMPQLVGHLGSMKSGEDLHSPAVRQPSQSFSMSEHRWVHTEQVWGHFSFTTAALSPSHSPFLPHAAHDGSLSLQ